LTGKPRISLTYGNVVATLGLAIALLGAGTAVATTFGFTLGATNRVDTPSRVTNLKSGGGANAINAPLVTFENTSTGSKATALNLAVDPASPPFTVNSGKKVAHLNADRVDGMDASKLGAVRDFHRSIAAASAGFRELLTFRGLTISSDARIVSGPLLECDLEATATDAGEFDNSWIFGTGSDAFALSSGTATPADGFFVARARGDDSRSVGQLVFYDAVTGHTVTVAYSVYGIPNADINGQGCTWQGTVTAAA
jgi:hypothetical protein